MTVTLMSWQERFVQSGRSLDFALTFLKINWTKSMLMKNVKHIGCYFTGEIQQLQLHFIVTSTMLCVILESGSITWPKNFVVRKRDEFLIFYQLQRPVPYTCVYKILCCKCTITLCNSFVADNLFLITFLVHAVKLQIKIIKQATLRVSRPTVFVLERTQF